MSIHFAYVSKLTSFSCHKQLNLPFTTTLTMMQTRRILIFNCDATHL